LGTLRTMSLSQIALTLTQAAEEHGEPAVHPWFVGGAALGILLLMLIILVAFGGGREHS
jgi:hypothetical protein